MTNRRGQGPEPRDDLTNLSEEDVERRLGGGAGLGGPVPERVAVTPPPPPPRPPRTRGGSVLWRDVLLVLVLLGFLGIGAQIVLNPASSTSSQAPGASTVALASPTSLPAPSPTATPTLAPTPTDSPLPSDLLSSQLPVTTPSPTPSSSPSPTPTAAPTPTPPPGATPTPRPTPTPAPTATLTISVLVVPLTGGNDVASDWQIAVSGANPSKATFSGSQSGTTIKVTAGKKYSIRTTAKTPNGYAQSFSGDCSGPLVADVQAQCTINETERPERLTVYVLGLPIASVVSVTISGTANANPNAFQGSAGGTPVSLWSNRPFTVSASDVVGFTRSTSGTCSGPFDEGEVTQCTFVYSAAPAVPAVPAQGLFAPLLLPLLGFRRRDRAIRRRR